MNYFNLRSTISSNSPANPEDTVRIKKTLNKLGYMEIPSYGLDDIPDKSLIDGIKNFQTDRNLKVDGIMKPGGETERTLNQIVKLGASFPKDKITQSNEATSSSYFDGYNKDSVPPSTGQQTSQAQKILASANNRKVTNAWAPPGFWGPWVHSNGVIVSPDRSYPFSVSYDTMSDAPSTFTVEILYEGKTVTQQGPGQYSGTLKANGAGAVFLRAKSHSLGQNLSIIFNT